MANTITDIMPKILAAGLLTLREQAIMPRLVNGDYSREAAEKGDTIDVPVPTANSVSDVTPSATPVTPTNTVTEKVQIALDQWKKANFHMSDKDMVEVDRNEHFMPMQAAEAVRALANEVNEQIHSEYKGIYGYVGAAGTTPFASVSDATGARKVLHKQKAPRNERRGVLDFDAEAAALDLSPFSDAEKTADNGAVKIEGEVGRKYGIDWFADDAVTVHTAGTLAATGAVVSGVVALAANTMEVKSASAEGNILIGDVFTIAGDTQTYVATNVVSAVVSTATQAVTFEPELQVALTGGEAIAFKLTHVVNLVFHRDAFAFANRPLVSSTQGLALSSNIMSATDRQTGITLRLEVIRQNKQVVWEFDILFGKKLVRAELATRLAG